MAEELPQHKWIDTGYKPRFHQDQLHRNVRRFSVIVAHRRFGKGVWSTNEIIDRALRCNKPNPKYAHISPFISQAKRNMWDIFKHYTKEIPGRKTNENELKIEIPRPTGDMIKINLFGADDPDAGRGQYFDGVVLDESAQIHPDVWKEVIRPALSDRLGWCYFIGTPKGKNFFYHVYMKFKEQMLSGNKDYYANLYKASETGIIAPSELKDARLTMDEPSFLQEYECDFGSANVGSYYGKILQKLEEDGKICDVPYNPALPVVTAWDLGMDDTTVIWFIQPNGPTFQVIDYIEDSGHGLAEYAKRIRDKPYVYLRHYLPHDVSVRDLSTGKARYQTLETLGVRPVQIVSKLKPADGIDAVRNILPRCVFDKSKCFRGLEGLREYQREWNAAMMRFEDKPKHDWASNPADSFRCFAVGIREIKSDHSSFPKTAIMDYDILG